MIWIKDFIKSCEKGMKECETLKLDSSIDRIIICGCGNEVIPAYIVKAFIEKPKVPILVNEGYTVPQLIKKHTLLVLISKDGYQEEIIFNYRLATREGLNIIIFNNSGKLQKLTEKNKDIQSVKLPEDCEYYISFGFILFGLLSLLNNNKFCEEIDNELIKTLMIIQQKDVLQLGLMFSKRIQTRIPLLFVTPCLLSISKAYKVLFNTVLKRRLFSSVFPLANHSDFYTYENSDDRFYSIILKDENTPGYLQCMIDGLKDQIKKNGQDVIEINLSSEYFLLKLLLAYLMMVSCIEYMQKEEQQTLDNF